MAQSGPNSPTQDELSELKEKCQDLVEADPTQAISAASLCRYLRAFKTPDAAFTALQKCHKWRSEYGVNSLRPEDEDICQEMITKKALVLRHRDTQGRPIVYIAARKHDANNRDIDRVTKFIVYLLETACERCNEDVIDNLCIVFDLKDFALSNMDYQFVKNLIWLLSKYYPERLGVCLIINAPILFHGCWAAIRPWLHEVTASKVTFITNLDQLCEYIHPDMLPED